MEKKVCVFVDGENFRFSILELYENFLQHDYLPKKAEWDKLFDYFVSLAVPQEGERLRTYWYVVQYLDTYPYRFPNIETETDTLSRLLCKVKWTKERLEGLKGDKLKKEMGGIVRELQERQRRMHYRFDGWRNLQNKIASKYSRIEFRRAGAITYDAFYKKLKNEKAVDVKLATDLITLCDIYDVAVIVSGDQDYVPAVRVVKDSGKTVINVAFLTRNKRLLPGGARRLNELTDDSIEIDYRTLAKYLKIQTKENNTPCLGF